MGKYIFNLIFGNGTIMRAILLEDDLLRSLVHLVGGGVFFPAIADENTAQSTRIFWADGICTKYFADSQIQHWILIGVFIGDCGEKYTTSDQV